MELSFYPILAFEESKLSPNLGYLFRRQWLDPCESVVSILWKFARMNRLPGTQGHHFHIQAAGLFERGQQMGKQPGLLGGGGGRHHDGLRR